MADLLNVFLERYGSAAFSHSEEIFVGLEDGTVRLVDVSQDIPCGMYAELFASKASQLNELDPCPAPELREEWRRIATHLAKAPKDEICRVWTFVGSRYSYRVFEVRSSQVLAGCETNDIVAQEQQLAKIAAIGVTFSADAIQGIAKILHEERFGFGAEGTVVSGYELYTAKDAASEAIELLKESGIMDSYRIRLYQGVRCATEGSRYDRLLDYLEGEDPTRPPYSGIHIDPLKNNPVGKEGMLNWGTSG